MSADDKLVSEARKTANSIDRQLSPAIPLPPELSGVSDLTAECAAEELRALASALEASEAKIAALTAKLRQREERLEITHHWVLPRDGDDLVRVEISEEDRDNEPDGIECRNETIRGLDEQIAALTAENATAWQMFASEAEKLADEMELNLRLDAEIATLREVLRQIAATRWDMGASEAALTMTQEIARAALRQEGKS